MSHDYVKKELDSAAVQIVLERLLGSGYLGQNKEALGLRSYDFNTLTDCLPHKTHPTFLLFFGNDVVAIRLNFEVGFAGTFNPEASIPTKESPDYLKKLQIANEIEDTLLQNCSTEALEGDEKNEALALLKEKQTRKARALNTAIRKRLPENPQYCTWRNRHITKAAPATAVHDLDEARKQAYRGERHLTIGEKRVSLTTELGEFLKILSLALNNPIFTNTPRWMLAIRLVKATEEAQSLEDIAAIAETINQLMFAPLFTNKGSSPLTPEDREQIDYCFALHAARLLEKELDFSEIRANQLKATRDGSYTHSKMVQLQTKRSSLNAWTEHILTKALQLPYFSKKLPAPYLRTLKRQAKTDMQADRLDKAVAQVLHEIKLENYRNQKDLEKITRLLDTPGGYAHIAAVTQVDATAVKAKIDGALDTRFGQVKGGGGAASQEDQTVELRQTDAYLAHLMRRLFECQPYCLTVPGAAAAETKRLKNQPLAHFLKQRPRPPAAAMAVQLMLKIEDCESLTTLNTVIQLQEDEDLHPIFKRQGGIKPYLSSEDLIQFDAALALRMATLLESTFQLSSMDNSALPNQSREKFLAFLKPEGDTILYCAAFCDTLLAALQNPFFSTTLDNGQTVASRLFRSTVNNAINNTKQKLVQAEAARLETDRVSRESVRVASMELATDKTDPEALPELIKALSAYLLTNFDAENPPEDKSQALQRTRKAIDVTRTDTLAHAIHDATTVIQATENSALVDYERSAWRREREKNGDNSHTTATRKKINQAVRQKIAESFRGGRLALGEEGPGILLRLMRDEKYNQMLPHVLAVLKTPEFSFFRGSGCVGFQRENSIWAQIQAIPLPDENQAYNEL